MTEAVLETERLILRPPAVGDLPWVLESMNTEAVMQFLGGEVCFAEEVEDRLADDIVSFSSGGHRSWTVWLRDQNCRVGRVGLFRVQSLDAPAKLRGKDEIGWTFAEAHWRQGYATEAARAVLDFAFDGLGFPMIYTQTSESNGPSTRMMQRLGLTRRSELDYVDPGFPDADNPTTIWSLKAEDWEQNGRYRD